MTESTIPRPAPPGLRERKRAAMMRRVRLAALDAFEARGFDRVTIDDVAAHAEVSASSIYRAFGTKEGLVLRDEADDDWTGAIADALTVDPPDRPSSALVRTLATADLATSMPDAARRIRLAIAVPSVRAAAGLEAEATADRIVAELERRDAADPVGARIAVRAVIAACFAGFEAWMRGAAQPRGLDDAIGHVLEVTAPLLDANAHRFRPARTDA